MRESQRDRVREGEQKRERDAESGESVRGN